LKSGDLGDCVNMVMFQYPVEPAAKNSASVSVIWQAALSCCITTFC
jgi:hypothetical protein